MDKTIVGVGFLLFHKNGDGNRIFTVREEKSKPRYHKEKGMISFPLETYEKEDQDFRRTIDRLLEEEVFDKGIVPWNSVEICGIMPECFQLIPGESRVFTRYGYGIFSGDHTQGFRPQDEDVTFAGWKTIRELLSCHIRIEVAPILNHFLLSSGYQSLLKKLS
jgi:hypothetical protein